ncbi:DUF4373 domain-containing protein [Alistipes senegalensis]|uniref:DUF4373 domain-containing protein n=1 Tax=Alistipes senegalensis TaxID=1288121 RepID=UPI002676DDE0|nr:DUF4373 domain-containing protein [Alistipes senegalensis]
MSKDCYYFPHDSNAKDDPKCVLMIEQLGMEGYGIYWMLVEALRDQPDYTYPVANIPALARRYNTSAEKVRTVVYNYELFTVKEDKIFFSESLNRRMLVFNENRAKRSAAGRLGMARRWGDNNVITPLLQSNSTVITSKVKESKVKEKESIEKVATKRTAFVAPSLQEVKDYISEKGYTVDAQRFIDFYEAKGWMIGKNKMKDWRAAVRTWMRRPDEPQKQTTYEMRTTNFL